MKGLEARNYDSKQLGDNRSRNVRHDSQGKDGKLQERSTGKQVH